MQETSNKNELHFYVDFIHTAYFLILTFSNLE